MKGGAAILSHFHGNLHSLFAIAHPTINWNDNAHLFKSKDKRSTQRWLLTLLHLIFPNFVIHEEYLFTCHNTNNNNNNASFQNDFLVLPSPPSSSPSLEQQHMNDQDGKTDESLLKSVIKSPEDMPSIDDIMREKEQRELKEIRRRLEIQQNDLEQQRLRLEEQRRIQQQQMQQFLLLLIQLKILHKPNFQKIQLLLL